MICYYSRVFTVEQTIFFYIFYISTFPLEFHHTYSIDNAYARTMDA